MPVADRLLLAEQVKELYKLLLAGEDPETAKDFVYQHEFQLVLSRVQRAANKSYYTPSSDDSTVEEAEAAYAQALERLEMVKAEFKSAEWFHAIAKEQIAAKKLETAATLTSTPALIHS
jgi:hypothetical protein